MRKMGRCFQSIDEVQNKNDRAVAFATALFDGFKGICYAFNAEIFCINASCKT